MQPDLQWTTLQKVLAETATKSPLILYAIQWVLPPKFKVNCTELWTLGGHISQEEFKKAYLKADRVSKAYNGLMNYLKKSDVKGTKFMR